VSHFLNIPINENGVITDLNLDVDVALTAAPPFAFTDIFIYSHGWWTSDDAASANYNTFSLGVAKNLQLLAGAVPSTLSHIKAGYSALAAACYWPSVLSEDPSSPLNLAEAASYFTMQHRADSVGRNAGYALLRLLIASRAPAPPLRYNLIGHSFGCRVVLQALQSLATDVGTLAQAVAANAEFRVVLIQAAADHDCLTAAGTYPDVVTNIPNLRLLATTSANDIALGKWYPRAQDVAHFFSDAVPALGGVGPAPDSRFIVTDRFDVNEYAVAPTVHQAIGTFAVANLTPLHQAHAAAYQQEMGGALPAGGQHSDIFLDEIYELVTRFVGN
jgi:hypothetical protein